MIELCRKLIFALIQLFTSDKEEIKGMKEGRNLWAHGWNYRNTTRRSFQKDFFYHTSNLIYYDIRVKEGVRKSTAL